MGMSPSVIQNDRYLRALKREPLPVPPVWLMRQAGRYLPEYRALRAQAGDFMSLCRHSVWAAEVTLQPIERFGLDAAIIFSDILTVPDAMGLGLFFVEQEGPRFEHPVRTAEDVARLPIIDAGALAYVMKAIETTKAALQGSIPLIGFCGSPWTVATYMVEGQSSRTFERIKTLLYREPQIVHALLEKVMQSSVAYLLGQIQAGADALMIFDTWGSVLSTGDYQDFSLAYMKRMVQALKARHEQIPITLFTKGGGLWLEAMAQTGCEALGLDWTISVQQARERVGQQVALQGNLDPLVLLAGPEVVYARTQRLLQEYEGMPGAILNLGHGLVPQTSIESVQAFIAAVRGT